MKENCFLWLTLRFMRKQKLRTCSIFCGIVFSGFLLHAFCALGCYFIEQASGEATESTLFDSSQKILVALSVLLLILVFACGGVLLRNLFSLTSVYRRQSMHRLLTLGARRKDILVMAVLETAIFTGVGVPFGYLLAFFSVYISGIPFVLPFWLSSCIWLWQIALCCCFGILPVFSYCDKIWLLPGINSRQLRQSHEINVAALQDRPFVSFMVKKYRNANRGHYRRITFTIIASILLYVPASYLIRTNLRVHAQGLHEKYGIEYLCMPDNFYELQDSMAQCRILKGTAQEAESVFYVCMPGTASISSRLLSSELIGYLEKAGWTQNSIWQADSEIYFLEDRKYQTFAMACSVAQEAVYDQPPAILINRYTNRTLFRKEADEFFLETSLVNEDAKKMLGKDRRTSADTILDIEVQCGFNRLNDQQEDTRARIYPGACSEDFPEGISSKDVMVILPLSELPVICTDIRYHWDECYDGTFVCGLFADTSETLYDSLLKAHGNGLGQLTYRRRDYERWYRSLSEIHLAMLSICGLLFFTALLNIFSTILFSCIQRRRGLAVLWSLGQSRKKLAAILIRESFDSFVHALLYGVPASCILCYAVYRIYRFVWHIGFILPFEQLLLITAAAAFTLAAAIAVSWQLLRRQDFLNEIREIL